MARSKEGKNKKENKNKRKDKKEKRGLNIFLKVLFTIFMIIIILMAVLIYLYNHNINNIFDKINTRKINVEELGISEEARQQHVETVKNVLLLGTDTGDLTSQGRTDSIIIASMNTKLKTLKLISIPRDTYVNIKGYAPQKINHSFFFGGPALMLNTINSNFDLALEDYVLIDYKGVAEIVEAVGGIDVKLEQGEINFINRYIPEMQRKTKLKTTYINKGPGVIHLDGVRAVAHARNRSVGSDFDRQERQRTIILKVLEKAKDMKVPDMLKFAEKAAGLVQTSLDKKEIIEYITEIGLNKNQYLKNIMSFQNPSLETHSGNHGRSADGLYVFKPNVEKTKELFAEYIYEK